MCTGSVSRRVEDGVSLVPGGYEPMRVEGPVDGCLHYGSPVWGRDLAGFRVVTGARKWRSGKGGRG